MGRVVTSVPTAASIAAAELGPFAWPASSLRLSSHERSGSRDTAGRAAPPVRVSCATPGLSTDCKLQRTGHSTDRFSTDQDQDFHPTDFHQDHEKSTRRRPPEDDHQKKKKKKTDLALCVPLYSSLLIAPPCFQLLWEASRREALPISNPSLLPLRRAGKTGGKIRAPSEYLLLFHGIIGIPCSFSLVEMVL